MALNRRAPWRLPLLGLLFFAPEAFANPCAIPAEVTVGLPPGARPVPVEIGILTVDILSVSDADQTFQIDAFTKVMWQDSRLADFAECHVSPQAIWNPHLELINSSELKTRQPPMARIGEEGRVELVRRFTGEVTSPHTLGAFPFDSRNLRLGVSSRGYSPAEVELVIAPQFTGRVEELSVADWAIGDHRAWVDTWDIAAIGETRSRINYELPAQRLRGYWVTKVMFPLALIIAMSWTVFWIDVAQLTTAIRMAATSMLTLIAFQFALASTLPRVSYLTVMDIFVFGAAVLIFLALVASVLTGVFLVAGKRELARRLNYHGRWVLPLAFSGLVGWICLQAMSN
jgi:hypothetical protein